MTQNNNQDADAKAKADAEAKAKAEADAANQSGADKGDQGDSSSKGQIDYKAIAEEEKRKRIEAEQAIIKAKLDKKKAAKDDGDNADDDDTDEDDKPITRKDLDAVVQSTRQNLTKEFYATQITEIAKELSESDDEAAAIVEVHKSRTFPAHLSLRDQLEEVHAIVNRKRLISKNSELARANRSKETASNDSAGTYRDGQEGTAPKMSTSDTQAYERAGFIYDAKDKLYKKKLPNGNILIKDPKTKMTSIRPK